MAYRFYNNGISYDIRPNNYVTVNGEILYLTYPTSQQLAADFPGYTASASNAQAQAVAAPSYLTTSNNLSDVQSASQTLLNLGGINATQMASSISPLTTQMSTLSTNLTGEMTTRVALATKEANDFAAATTANNAEAATRLANDGTETTARLAGDSKETSDIAAVNTAASTEATTRGNADTAEANTRSTAIASLQSQINAFIQPAVSTFSLTPVAAGTGTTGGNTGTQIHATKFSQIACSYSTQITYTLSGSQVSSVIHKICPTNDPNEANWIEAGRTETKQNSGLAVTVGQSVGGTGQISHNLPAGWFVKAVASGTGTHTEAYVSGQKTIYG